ncbi:MAG TPA: hypothetical protein VFM94_00900, partial [Solirubrobacterales bacterium]|nr:hypothetical protein [Solirubrobacterales bacterium]
AYSGDCTGATCSLTMTANKSVTATFTLKQWTLTIAKAGTGSGKVECDTGSGFAACAASYPNGTAIVVKATPAAHSTFTSWAGCDSQPAADKCGINSLTSNKTVTATFTAIVHTLSVGKAGSGGGSVSCNGGACVSSYVEGTVVTLEASADAGSGFAGWSGACSGSGDCVLTIDGDSSATATFNNTGSGGGGGGSGGEQKSGTAAAPATATVQGGKALIELSCSGGPCQGVVKLFAKLPGQKSKSVLIGKSSFSLAEGTRKKIKVKISSKQARKLLKQGRTLKAQIKGSGLKTRNVKLRQPGGGKASSTGRRS